MTLARDKPWRVWAAHNSQTWLYKPFNSRMVLRDGEVALTQRELDRFSSPSLHDLPTGCRALARAWQPRHWFHLGRWNRRNRRRWQL